VRIGELARAAGVGVETVRFYERRGLLPAGERTVSGYRTYGAEDVERLRFIRRAKTLGFELREIGELLSLREDETTSCGEVRRRAAAKIAGLERRIAEVDAIRRALQRLAAECGEGGASGACPLLRHLAEETQEA
jgi:MerR family mercuric resistance operon transcriptional regulator